MRVYVPGVLVGVGLPEVDCADCHGRGWTPGEGCVYSCACRNTLARAGLVAVVYVGDEDEAAACERLAALDLAAALPRALATLPDEPAS